MPPITVRPIAIADSRPLRQSILRPHESVTELAAHEPAGAHALGAFDGERLISVGFVAPDGEPGSWRVRGMASAEGDRGRGAGTAVLEALLLHARAAGARRVWCNARPAARTLYERAGMRIASGEFEIPGIGTHVLMELRER